MTTLTGQPYGSPDVQALVGNIETAHQNGALFFLAIHLQPLLIEWYKEHTELGPIIPSELEALLVEVTRSMAIPSPAQAVTGPNWQPAAPPYAPIEARQVTLEQNDLRGLLGAAQVALEMGGQYYLTVNPGDKDLLFTLVNKVMYDGLVERGAPMP